MAKLRAYIETTIFNRYFEIGREYANETKKLFEEIKSKRIVPFTSTAVIDELNHAPSPKKEQMLKMVSDYKMTIFEINDTIAELADAYVKAEIIPSRFRADGLHIATAAVNDLDCIISLNFHHINKIKTKLMTEAINHIKGYNNPIICSPEEVIL
jgi:predicted nucleic acid-binding protein